MCVVFVFTCITNLYFGFPIGENMQRITAEWKPKNLIKVLQGIICDAISFCKSCRIMLGGCKDWKSYKAIPETSMTERALEGFLWWKIT